MVKVPASVDESSIHTLSSNNSIGPKAEVVVASALVVSLKELISKG